MSVHKSGDTFIKTDYNNPTSMELEALCLDWLAEGMAQGGAHVVPVVRVKKGEIVTRAAQSSSVTKEAAFQFGRALALTHAMGADFHGQAPPGWEGDGWMGRSELTYLSSPAPNWGTFYAEQRVLPHLPMAVDNGSITRFEIRLVEALCERLRDGDFDSPQPALVSTPSARIHGDLWTGNVIWSPRDSIDWAPPKAGLGTTDAQLPSTVGVLIDPASSGGHGEKDLADLGVFGQPYLDAIYSGYESESKLEPAWQERVPLHQLHILMVHANLFGGSYGSHAIAVCKKYL